MKVYLGDAVYADWDGFNVTLTTEDGIRATNTVVLEPQVVIALQEFLMKTELWDYIKRVEER